MFAIVMLLPCIFLFTACGEIKKLEGKTLVYSKIEVTGSLEKEEYESSYKLVSFTFDKDTMTYKDGSQETEEHEYKLENGKVYLKSEGEEFPTTHYAEVSGKYMIVTETYNGGTVKVYFKVK